MRYLTFLLLSAVSLSSFAAPAPGNMEPAPQPPAFTPDSDASPESEPEITIIKQTELTIEEFRAGGKLYMIKVTPKVGAPYYLVDQRGDGKFARQESLDSGFRAPQWIIHKF